MDSIFLGIDLGTSAVKAIVVDEAGRTVAGVSAGVSSYQSEGSGHEQAAEDVWTSMVAAVRSALAGLDVGRVKAAAFSAAMHGFMAVDGQGRPLMRMMAWADGRSQAEAEALRKESGTESLARTGCPPTALYYPARLRWLKQGQPNIFRQAAKFVSIKDWIIYRLTGRWTMDRSHASSNGLLDIHRLQWDGPTLALAGIGPERLPELVEPDAAVGELLPEAAQQLGLPAGIAIVPGAGDGGLANLGSGAVDPGQAAATIGTSGAMRKVLSAPWVEPEGRLWCYYLAEGRWYAGGAINSGGAVLRWLRDGLLAPVRDQALASGREPYERIIELAQEAGPGAGGLMLLPYLQGERTPYWDPLARGVYFGIAPHHGPAHFARAALEGICYAMAHVHELLAASPGGIGEVRASGGFARSEFWLQLMADVMGQPLARPQVTEGSALGAAILAMKAAGAIATLAAAKDFIAVEKIFDPDRRQTAFHRERFEFFKDLYARLEPEFARWASLAQTPSGLKEK
jgi:gluconokinase